MGKLGGRPPAPVPEIGCKIGLWEVVGHSVTVDKSVRVPCRCACGRRALVLRRNLVAGGSQSCRNCYPARTRKCVIVPGWFWAHLTCSARKRGIEIAITKEYAESLLLQQNRLCAFSGREIHIETDSTLARSRSTASLDRKDSSRGYVEGNVQWVHKTVNLMKNVLEENQFIGLVSEIASYRLKR